MVRWGQECFLRLGVEKSIIIITLYNAAGKKTYRQWRRAIDSYFFQSPNLVLDRMVPRSEAHNERIQEFLLVCGEIRQTI